MESELVPRYQQPREDVVGIDRTGDDLLSLDERAVAHWNALIAMAKHLRTACGVGNPAPIVADIGKRIHNPQVGDLVVECTRVIWGHRRTSDDDRLKGLGYLVEHRTEWAHTDDEWQRALTEDGYEADERPTDEAWYVQYGPDPGDVCRWTNCDF